MPNNNSKDSVSAQEMRKQPRRMCNKQQGPAQDSATVHHAQRASEDESEQLRSEQQASQKETKRLQNRLAQRKYRLKKKKKQLEAKGEMSQSQAKGTEDGQDHLALTPEPRYLQPMADRVRIELERFAGSSTESPASSDYDASLDLMWGDVMLPGAAMTSAKQTMPDSFQLMDQPLQQYQQYQPCLQPSTIQQPQADIGNPFYVLGEVFGDFESLMDIQAANEARLSEVLQDNNQRWRQGFSEQFHRLRVMTGRLAAYNNHPWTSTMQSSAQHSQVVQGNQNMGWLPLQENQQYGSEVDLSLGVVR